MTDSHSDVTLDGKVYTPHERQLPLTELLRAIPVDTCLSWETLEGKLHIYHQTTVGALTRKAAEEIKELQSELAVMKKLNTRLGIAFTYVAGQQKALTKFLEDAGALR